MKKPTDTTVTQRVAYCIEKGVNYIASHYVKDYDNSLPTDFTLTIKGFEADGSDRVLTTANPELQIVNHTIFYGFGEVVAEEGEYQAELVSNTNVYGDMIRVLIHLIVIEKEL